MIQYYLASNPLNTAKLTIDTHRVGLVTVWLLVTNNEHGTTMNSSYQELKKN